MDLTNLLFLAITSLSAVSAEFEFICTPEGLFTPYLHVYRGRNGSKLFSAGPGFYDFRNEIDVYVCINGPAYQYFSHNTTLGEVYETPSFQFFVHMCGMFNKSPNGGHIHSVNETLKKLHGVLLMGDPTDYRKPFVQLMIAPAYNYATHIYENGTSIFIIGEKECLISKDRVKIKIQPKAPAAADKPQYCARAYGQEGAVAEEEELMKATSPLTVIGCKDSTAYTTAEEDQTKFDSAADLAKTNADTAFQTAQAITDATAKDKAVALAQVAVDAAKKLTDAKGFKTVKVEAECVELPNVVDTCKAGKPDETQACTLFKTLIGETPPSYTGDKEWRKEIIRLISEIYLKACPGTQRRFTTAIDNLFGSYLLAGLAAANPAKPEPPVTSTTWKFIAVELTDCLEQGRRIELQEGTEGSNTVFMKDGQPTTINYLLEEADNEFAFNWVIDAHWKMFATVMGICIPQSKDKTSTISNRFYMSYAEDFLQPVAKPWIEFKDNLVYQYILSEFYNKRTDARMTDCLEASFMQNNAVSYRPLRPVAVNENQDNYFINWTMLNDNKI